MYGECNRNAAVCSTYEMYGNPNAPTNPLGVSIMCFFALQTNMTAWDMHIQCSNNQGFIFTFMHLTDTLIAKPLTFCISVEETRDDFNTVMSVTLFCAIYLCLMIYQFFPHLHYRLKVWG